MNKKVNILITKTDANNIIKKTKNYKYGILMQRTTINQIKKY